MKSANLTLKRTAQTIFDRECDRLEPRVHVDRHRTMWIVSRMLDRSGRLHREPGAWEPAVRREINELSFISEGGDPGEHRGVDDEVQLVVTVLAKTCRRFDEAKEVR